MPFITFEGGEGSGKSTQIARLSSFLSTLGISHQTTREPGGTEGAELVRTILVQGCKDRWLPKTETLLFYAARVDLVERVIKPALQAGEWVLCDRFTDSTRAYQGFGHQLTDGAIVALNHWALGDFKPDLTFLLTPGDPAAHLARTKERTHDEDRYESMALSFHERVKEGFLTIAAGEPDRFVILNADLSIQEIATQIQAVIKQRFL